MNAARLRRLASLRWRISLAITAVVFLCTILAVGGAWIFLSNALTDRATTEMRNTLNGVSGFVNDQKPDLLGAGRLLAFDPAVVDAARARDRQALVVHLTPLYAELNVDLMDVTDARGRVLVRMEDTIHRGDSIAFLPSVRRALSGYTIVGPELDRSDPAGSNGFSLRATFPLRSGSRIVGVVSVGRQLDNTFADHLSHALSADVNLIAGTQRTGTTLTDSQGLPVTGVPEPTAVLARIALGRNSTAREDQNGQTVISGLVPLQDSDGRWVGGVEVVRSLGPVFDVIRNLTHLLVGLGAVVVIIGMFLALVVSRRVTSRLRVLEAIASRVAEQAATAMSVDLEHGGLPLPQSLDQTARTAIQGNDEVASLARSFGAMIDALDQRIATTQERVRELTGLAEIARLLTAGPSVHETVDLLGARVCTLTGSVAVAIWLPGEGTIPALYGGHGLPPEYEPLVRDIALDATNRDFATAAQQVFETGQTISASMAEPLPIDVPENHRSLRAALNAIGACTVTSVPLRLQDRIVGALSCYFASETPLSGSELGLLTTIGDQVAVAVENARLYSESRDLAALEERQRLARELHDSVSQALYGIALGARTARTMLGRDPEKAAEPLDYVIAQAQAGLTEMRALIFELRPETLAADGLVVALGKNVDALRVRHNIEVQADLGTEPDIPLPLKQTLHRIAQEALHNIVKHAGAGHVSLTLSCSRGEIELDIRDDGRGFDPESSFPGHLGLRTMRERAMRLGGTLIVESAPGAGTHLHLRVPVLIEGTAA